MDLLRTNWKGPGVLKADLHAKIPSSQTFLLLSDVHYDSVKCRRDLLTKHLNQAKEQGALILIFGDWFDLMATYNDPRSKAQDIDPKYLSKDFSYLDMVIEDSIEFLRAYADNILLISEGNHETKIKEKHDTNPLKRLVDGLTPYSSIIHRGNYTGFLELCEQMYAGNENGSNRVSYLTNLHWNHGFGGSAKRSKGMLDVQLEAMQYPDAHILCRGHDHQKWYDPSTMQVRKTKSGKLVKNKVRYLKTGSYKDGYEQGEGGFEIEKNFRPVELGGWWMSLVREDRRNSYISIKEAL